jgi:hypothetical protein
MDPLIHHPRMYGRGSHHASPRYRQNFHAQSPCRTLHPERAAPEPGLESPVGPSQGHQPFPTLPAGPPVGQGIYNPDPPVRHRASPQLARLCTFRTNRAATLPLAWRVAGQLAGTVRGGNLCHSASASALSCHGRAAVFSSMLAVTAAPGRTTRPGSPGGTVPAAARASVPAAWPAGDAPGRSR